MCAKRTAEDRINLLKLLKDGAIFCSERYPEDAEAIDAEIRRQLNDELQNHNNLQQHQQQIQTTNTKTIEQVQTTNNIDKQQQQHQKLLQYREQQTITIVVTDTNLQNDNNTTSGTATTKNTGNTKTPDI